MGFLFDGFGVNISRFIILTTSLSFVYLGLLTLAFFLGKNRRGFLSSCLESGGSSSLRFGVVAASFQRLNVLEAASLALMVSFFRTTEDSFLAVSEDF